LTNSLTSCRADVVGENLCALLFCMIVITSCRPFICGVSVCCMLRYISLFTPQSLEQVSAKKVRALVVVISHNIHY
jgi:hypothetical protein